MTISTHPPIEIPLERMTSQQKLALVRELINDLCQTANAGEDESAEYEIPQWHLEVLAEREKAIASGEMELLPLDQFLEEVRKACP